MPNSTGRNVLRYTQNSTVVYQEVPTDALKQAITERIAAGVDPGTMYVFAGTTLTIERTVAVVVDGVTL